MKKSSTTMRSWWPRTRRTRGAASSQHGQAPGSVSATSRCRRIWPRTRCRSKRFWPAWTMRRATRQACRTWRT
eukprot:7338989-Heterocapsa_arctica.AAC.1